MKNLKNNNNENQSLIQDIFETYRYPDGTLNKIAVLISALALALIVTLGHFTINGIKSLQTIKSVSANELKEYADSEGNGSSNSNQNSENNTYSQEEIQALISLLEQEIAATTDTSSSQYSELCSQLELLKTYSNTQVIENKADLTDLIEELKKTYANSIGAKIYIPGETYNKGEYVIYEGNLYISLVDGNTSAPTDSSKWKLADIENIIKNLEKKTQENINKYYTELNENITVQGKDFQKQIDQINDRISDNDTYFDFGYDENSGAYGYYVNGQFKPW